MKFPTVRQKLYSAGGRGVPQFLFRLESYFLCELGAHAQFWNPTTTFENPFCLLKNVIVLGLGGVPEFCFGWNPNIFVS